MNASESIQNTEWDISPLFGELVEIVMIVYDWLISVLSVEPTRNMQVAKYRIENHMEDQMANAERLTRML